MTSLQQRAEFQCQIWAIANDVRGLLGVKGLTNEKNSDN